jgi:hypothetical protein
MAARHDGKTLVISASRAALGTRRRIFATQLLAAAAVSFMACFAGSARATTLPVAGGPSGAYFEESCAPGQYLVGFSVGSGAWIDSIAILCAPYVPAQHRFGSRTKGARHGGNGGSPQEAYCPVDSFVHAIDYGFTRQGNDPLYVDDVGMMCALPGGGGAISRTVCIETGEGCGNFNEGADVQFFATSAGVGASYQGCPPDEAATGIHGRSGNSLDALGLLCSPEPTGKSMGRARPPVASQQTPSQKILQGGAASALKNPALAWGGTSSASAPASPAGPAPASSPLATAAGMRAAAVAPFVAGASAPTPAATPAAPPPPGSSAPGASTPAAPAPAPSAAPGQPPSYLLTCSGGGGMRAKSTQDGFVRIAFTPATQGSAAAAPRRGECAWSDRGFRPGEPQMLVYSGGGKPARDLVQAAHRGEMFQVHAYNNNQGAMIVTSIDGIRSSNASTPISGSTSAPPPAQVPPAPTQGLRWGLPATSAAAPSARATQTGIIIVGGKTTGVNKAQQATVPAAAAKQ